jgi:hypothetical protein
MVMGSVYRECQFEKLCGARLRSPCVQERGRASAFDQPAGGTTYRKIAKK